MNRHSPVPEVPAGAAADQVRGGVKTGTRAEGDELSRSETAPSRLTNMDDHQKHEIGMEIRRAVLGDAHVDRTRVTAFNKDFQDLITRYAWGEIWARPGLPRHSRSLVTLAMMVALNRPEEFRLHLRAALNNDVTRDEIKEVLLQTAIYCGLPAANSAFRAAEEIFSEIDGKQ